LTVDVAPAVGNAERRPCRYVGDRQDPVADLGPELLKHPRIRFYADHNPEWADGVELACVAEVTLWIPLRYTLKRIAKTLRLKSKSPAELPPLPPKES
jgi:hypothetical protein